MDFFLLSFLQLIVLLSAVSLLHKFFGDRGGKESESPCVFSICRKPKIKSSESDVSLDLRQKNVVFKTGIEVESNNLKKDVSSSTGAVEEIGLSESRQYGSSFEVFEMKYLSVFVVASFADWVQGPYQYVLFESKFSEDEIGIIFMTGVASSMVFGSFIGTLADKYGRARICCLYCISYGIACLSYFFSTFYIVFFGRVLSGIASSILSSTFESWLVCAHYKNSFPSEYLSKTFAKATVLKSLAAIVAGFLAQVLFNEMGPWGPFCFSIFSQIILFFMIRFMWEENYGDSSETSSVVALFVSGCTDVFEKKEILLLGIVQTLFEACMYIFVFAWTPSLEWASPLPVNHGYVFSCFMICCMLGGMLKNIFNFIGASLFLLIVVVIYFFAFLSLFLFQEKSMKTQFGLFLLLELCVGGFWPSLSLLKSILIPESTRSTIMSMFRTPMNLIVLFVIGNRSNMNEDTMWYTCTILTGIACIIQFKLYFSYYALILEKKKIIEDQKPLN